jgi:prevent-host-death family protein
VEKTDMDDFISIGQVKRDISKLVNRVAFGAERIVLTSRGKPKAVLISLEDYEKLQKINSNSLDEWEEWKKRAEVIVGRTAERTGGTPINFDAILEANRTDLEDRHAWIASRD